MKFRDFSVRYKALVREFEQELEAFLQEYPKHKEEAEESKGELYVEGEYPHVLAVRQKFSVELSTLPFPNMADFRVEAPEEVIKEIQEGMDSSLLKIYKKVGDEVHALITSRLEVMHASLTSGKGFKKTIFDELEHALSFAVSFGDALHPSILSLVRRVRTAVLAKTPEQVRNSDALKDAIVNNIEEVLREFPT
jgi:hypothetical protein